MSTPESPSVKELVQDTEERLKELLERNSDLIASSAQKEILRRELNLVLEGRNSNLSVEPGLSAIITRAAKDSVLSLKREKDYPIQEDQFTRVNDGLWRMRLDRGVFLCGLGGCEFHLEAAEDWDSNNRDRAQYPVRFPYDDVVRIEGDSGELWHNGYYNWDGSPRNYQ